SVCAYLWDRLYFKKYRQIPGNISHTADAFEGSLSLYYDGYRFSVVERILVYLDIDSVGGAVLRRRNRRFG
ncbi:MAG: hypothetical protein OXC79_12550, partial [Candidatus Poribacteria bacterium]|nr:hypothetical protein [Candidatus Poribacteria bacterium]